MVFVWSNKSRLFRSKRFNSEEKYSMPTYPIIKFNQYNSSGSSDELYLFSALAKDLAQWAGIPRKGWHIRMLYQRPIKQSREQDLIDFWNTAGDKNGGYILGPTAITIGIQNDIRVEDDNINLHYKPTVDILAGEPEDNLRELAKIIIPSVVSRLDTEQNEVIEEFKEKPFSGIFPDISHDYVFEFALQLHQMVENAEKFLEINDISNQETKNLIEAMEAICRPAVVVDGQHRLWGAANASHDINLPVVAIPNCAWTDQIYQFVVINEKAQKVETSLLTDIFGSSLTQVEQKSIREVLARANVEIEDRIAAVIANREEESPFHDMVVVRLDGNPPGGAKPYLTEGTIRLLIEGSTGRSTRGWRTDDEFYERYVRPTFPNREEWDSWHDGYWRVYWFNFWRAVADYYNEQAAIYKRDESYVLWNKKEQTNLTKGVTLRQIQRLYIEKAVENIEKVDSSREILVESLGEEEAESKIKSLIADRAIPESPEEFYSHVISWFLEGGVPVRFFTANWIQSLDDQQGTEMLYDQLENAWTKENIRIRGGIFIPNDDQR
jgi:hypothetical protein